MHLKDLKCLVAIEILFLKVKFISGNFYALYFWSIPE